MTIAEKIAQLPFYQANRDADLLAYHIAIIEKDRVWTFSDGSVLYSVVALNKVIVE